MPSGPDHYLIAEQLADDAARAHDNGKPERMQALIGIAQIHATLALAAATALESTSSLISTATYREWVVVAAEPANQ
jgi:hypothetical protein